MAKLADKTVDFRYRNPHDTAIAAYLYSLIVSSPQVLLVACRIALAAQNTSLSSKLVQIITDEWARSFSSNSQPFPSIAANNQNPPTIVSSSFITTDATHPVNDYIRIAPISGVHVFPFSGFTMANQKPESNTKYSFAIVTDPSFPAFGEVHSNNSSSFMVLPTPQVTKN